MRGLELRSRGYLEPTLVGVIEAKSLKTLDFRENGGRTCGYLEHCQVILSPKCYRKMAYLNYFAKSAFSTFKLKELNIFHFSDETIRIKFIRLSTNEILEAGVENTFSEWGLLNI